MTFSNTQITAILDLVSSFDTSSVTNMSYMFYQTFSNTQITAILDLVSSFDTSSVTNMSYMFQGTFSDCTNLTQIPDGLFETLDTSSATDTSGMFSGTFRNCTNLTGYIPPAAFPSTIKPGSSLSTQMWYQTFYGTNLATTCPAGTTEYNSGFENDWGYSNSNTTTSGTYRVSCEPCAALPEHATYVSGSCSWNCDEGFTEDNGACVIACAGAMYLGGCHEMCSIGGGVFHVGNAAYPMFADRTGISTPALNIIDEHGTICHVYFEADTGVEHGLKVLYKGTVYHAIDPR